MMRSSVGRKSRNSKDLKREAAPKPRLPETYLNLNVDDLSTFNPMPLSPIPDPEMRRRNGSWWIRCTGGSLIDLECCYKSFVDVNALNNKKHPCWNCPLGKTYREMRAEGQIRETMFDNLVS